MTTPNGSKYDVIVIDGGFYGSYIANHFSRQGRKVLLYEMQSDLMQRASFFNQARIHNGYHYPRDILTALKSRMLSAKFIQEFSECTEKKLSHYYMISKHLSKITTDNFISICKRIGAPIQKASQSIVNLTNPDLIDSVFEVQEYLFDADCLRREMKKKLHNSNTYISFCTKIDSIEKDSDYFKVTGIKNNVETITSHAKFIFNCTYANLNYIHNNIGCELIQLTHEMTEICLVDIPDELKKIGITVMCGPFFSMLPFPTSKGLHSFSHVRYTPHYCWADNDQNSYVKNIKDIQTDGLRTKWKKMQKDAQRYIPILEQAKYCSSNWEIKTILPKNAINDGRPILFKHNYVMKGYSCIMGGKIDNIYDIISEIESKYY